MKKSSYTLSIVMVAQVVICMTMFTLFYRYNNSGRSWGEAARLAAVYTAIGGVVHLAYWTWFLKKRRKESGE